MFKHIFVIVYFFFFLKWFQIKILLKAEKKKNKIKGGAEEIKLENIFFSSHFEC